MHSPGLIHFTSERSEGLSADAGELRRESRPAGLRALRWQAVRDLGSIQRERREQKLASLQGLFHSCLFPRLLDL